MQILPKIRQAFHNYWIPLVYVLVGIAAYKIIADNYKLFLDISLGNLLWLVLANLVFLVFYGIAWGFCLKVVTKDRANMKEASALAFFHQFSFLSLGKGALASTTTIIKDRYGASYTSSFSYICLITSFFISFNSIFAILTLIMVGYYNPLVWAGFIFLIGLSSSFLFVTPSMPVVHKINSILKKIIPFYYYLGIAFLRIVRVIMRFRLLKKPKYYIFLYAMNALSGLGMILRYMFSYASLNFDVGFWKSSLISLVTSNILCFAAITPGALGVKESIDTFFADFVNVPIHSTLTAVLLDRVVNIACLAALNFYAAYVLFRTK